MLPFIKMHGLGNDYLYLDATDPTFEAAHDWPTLARAMSNRHTGVGSDGLILICSPTPDAREQHAAVRMRMFNADGSEAQMCGNGLRCVAKFAHDRLGLRTQPLIIQTPRGLLSVLYQTANHQLTSATVNMGEPILDLARIPINPAATSPHSTHEHTLTVAGRAFLASFVSMGNPHAVIFDQALDIAALGPTIEHHPAFPERVNVHAVAVRSRTHAIVHTWERGSGLTQACGTGACAVLVAGVLTNRLDRDARITLPGGDLHIRWDQPTNHVFMTGPANDVCEGHWPLAAAPLDARPTLTTERLLLRPFHIDDAPAVVALAGDRRVAETTLLIPHPYPPEQALRWIAMQQGQFATAAGVTWAITLRDTATVIGAIGLQFAPPHRRAELGYWIGVPHWNLGYATEAARTVLAFAFDSLRLHRVEAHYQLGNDASGRVMEKIGMTREGLLRGHTFKNGSPRDGVIYAALNPNTDSH